MRRARRSGAVLGGIVVALVAVACGNHGSAAVAADARPVPTPPVTRVEAGAPNDAAVVAVDAGPSLASDVAARARDARSRFGAAARIRTVGDTFVLVEAGPPSPLFDKTAALIERALPPLFDGRFSKHPDEGVTVLLFPTAEGYRAYSHARFPGTGINLGVYQPARREIAGDVSQGAAFLTTFTHEIVHPILDGDFPEAPLWLKEGIASLFEAPVFGKDGSIHGEPRNWRDVDYLQPAFASPVQRKMLRLDALFGMSARTFKEGEERATGEAAREIEGVHYALARSVCAWMDAQAKLWPFYRAWRDGFEADETGEKAFRRVMGGTPREVNGKWVGWAAR